jgi:RND family efflux transporter MFP subunit
MSVAVETIEIVDHHMVQRRFSGQIEARQQTALGFERPGTIIEVRKREGDPTVKGEVLAKLDTRLLEAELARIEASKVALGAQVELATRTNKRQSALRERGFASQQTLDDTSLGLTRLQARIAELDALKSSIEINLAKSDLVAPFDGVIGSRLLDEGAVAASGSPVVTLLQTGPSRFRTGLDPVLADGLQLGEEVTLSISNFTRPGKLTQIAPGLDPATRNRTAFFEVLGPNLPSGATGEVVLETKVEVVGAWIPLSALDAGGRGLWTILTVIDGTVRTEAAEILHMRGDEAFVRGTFEDGAKFIPGGTHRVVPGQKVTVGRVAQLQGALSWKR